MASNLKWAATQMKAPASLIRFRRSTVLRLMAMWLLVLVISPFTAPFSTWDLGVLTAHAPMSAALLPSDKRVKDDVTTDVVSHALTPVLVALFFPLGTIASQIESRQLLQIVLRL